MRGFTMATMIAVDKATKKTGWDIRHNSALGAAINGAVNVPFESPIARMLESWGEYAKAHRARYESKIGDDGVLGQEWEAIGIGIRGLLNGETGRLDCGTLDAFILDTLSENGVDISKL
jgi:hypothetical protein